MWSIITSSTTEDSGFNAESVFDASSSNSASLAVAMLDWRAECKVVDAQLNRRIREARCRQSLSDSMLTDVALDRNDNKSGVREFPRRSP